MLAPWGPYQKVGERALYGQPQLFAQPSRSIIRKPISQITLQAERKNIIYTTGAIQGICASAFWRKAALGLPWRGDENRAGSTFRQNEFLLYATGAVEPGQVGPHLLVSAKRSQHGGQNGCGGGIGRRTDAVMHPFALAPRGNDAGFAQVGEMAGDLGLALTEDLDKVADADLAPGHQVEQAQASLVSQSRKDAGQIDRLGAATHENIIYGLTNMAVPNIFAKANVRREPWKV